MAEAAPPQDRTEEADAKLEHGTGPDWFCTRCQAVNFDLRKRCRFCSQPRSEVEGVRPIAAEEADANEATVERVARAICAALGWSWEDAPQTDSDRQERCRSAARAALAAERVKTERERLDGMVTALRKIAALDKHSGSSLRDRAASEIARATLADDNAPQPERRIDATDRLRNAAWNLALLASRPGPRGADWIAAREELNAALAAYQALKTIPVA